MKTFKSIANIALVLALAGGLSGCFSDTRPTDDNDQNPIGQAQELTFMESPNPTMDFEDETGHPVHTGDRWKQLTSGDIEIALHGSSSCPPTVEKVTKEGPTTVKVELKKMETLRACTKDYRAFYVTVVGAGEVEKVELLSNTDGKVSELPKNTQSVITVAPITADPEAKLNNTDVEVKTEPASLPKSETTPEAALPAVQPVQEMMSPVAAPAPVKVEVPAVAAVPAPTGHEWIQATMAKYGVYPEAGTQFVIGPMPAGCYGAHGCTEFSYYPDTGVAFDYTITIAPGQLTEYLLFHEIAHARGIRDECGADNFARSVLGPVPGHYC